MNDILVASDYDRTLASENNNFVIDSYVAEKVNEFSKKYKFVVVSGREKRFIDILAPNLSPTAWILENGALIFYGNKKYTLCDMEWNERKEKITKILDRLSVKYSVGEVIIYVNNYVNRIRDLEEVEKYATLEINRNDIMILPKGIDKGTSLIKFKQLIKFNGKVVAIGDSENDYALFRVADIKVAVNNALPQVKQIADIITSKPNGLGVLEVLEKILNNELQNFSK
ncbi:phosphoglycolate phosphatase [Sulfolobus sp. A20]|nr:phosphoglycolate phosphatase [Sulfolobus sp. A20]TRM74057.1 phosphoglycolate phosphatase [Sulfolobus sp. E5]TRM78001.1 phosphoglycolate phosphatase [Sulfolobus sp. A20-N-F8]TRM78059.1 phosphoglycolate phosphatase [Sulfolobus sp. B5]TRM81284.1 phosphoglycolate phosphatase [Sulfolobus sp. D5]TRM84216.1 phosphoglycolate phosphatase [Sulfolobus sp. F3]TRM87397.1 phosphoglycolate phosphatase [Sulfolobus sp. C3]TRM88361.1 phosphoglycolate phosphatase [Sulfolobus sp. E3]TRM98778.1 phosphoglycol